MKFVLAASPHLTRVSIASYARFADLRPRARSFSGHQHSPRTTTPPMASLARPSLLPQCSSCIRRVTRLGLEQRGQRQQTRNISKAAKEAERNIIVKLLLDVPRFGRAGTPTEGSAWRLLKTGQALTSPSTHPSCGTNGSPRAPPTTYPLFS